MCIMFGFQSTFLHSFFACHILSVLGELMLPESKAGWAQKRMPFNVISILKHRESIGNIMEIMKC